ncbi:hypothetical protein EHM92_07730, partial [bacterium]
MLALCCFGAADEHRGRFRLRSSVAQNNIVARKTGFRYIAPMSKATKIVIGLLGVLVVIGIAVYFFVRYEIRKSFPRTEGTVVVAGLADPVEITRDEYGVPVIEARNNHDLMFSLGYAHAQDRLWQMDVTRRLGQGRLSELLGDVTVPFDRMFRIVGIRRIAEEVERGLSKESRDMLQWYSDGVNAY